MAPAGRRRLGGEGEAARDGAGRNGTARRRSGVLFALSFLSLMDGLRGLVGRAGRRVDGPGPGPDGG
jgi:hypothetical protein